MKGKDLQRLPLIVLVVGILFVVSPPFAAGEQAETGQHLYAHENINLRSGPGEKHPAIGRLLPGESVVVLRKEGEWGELQRSRGKAFVLVSLLQKEPLPPLQIVNWDWRKAPRVGRKGVVVWVVEVRNNSDRHVDHVQAEMRTYDRKGRLLHTAVTHLRGIKPGKIGGSRSFATLTGKEASAQVRIVPEEGGAREEKKGPPQLEGGEAAGDRRP